MVLGPHHACGSVLDISGPSLFGTEGPGNLGLSMPKPGQFEQISHLRAGAQVPLAPWGSMGLPDPMVDAKM